ncbi:S-adenosylmethionine synthetase N-terminal domain-containing protein [Serratia ureilytica]
MSDAVLDAISRNKIEARVACEIAGNRYGTGPA